MPNKAFVIGVSGGSGSGKSTFSTDLLKHLDNAYYLKSDSYFKDPLPNMISPLNGKEYPDYNHPTSVDFPALIAELKKILYSYDYIVVDGAYIFCIEELLEFFDYKVFIDAAIETRLFRRITRNLKAGHTLEFIGDYYLSCARYREKEYSIASAVLADIRVDNELSMEEMDLTVADIVKEKRASII